MSFLRICFIISQYYNEREIEELFSILQGRGGIIQRVSGPTHCLFIPIEANPLPFYDTIRNCDSVARIDTAFYPAVLNLEVEA